MAQLNDYKAVNSFQEPLSSSLLTTSAQKMTPQTKIYNKISEENPEDFSEIHHNNMEMPKINEKRSLSKVETSTAKKHSNKSAVKIVEQGESLTDLGQPDITPKIGVKVSDDFKTAAKKVTVNSKTATK